MKITTVPCMARPSLTPSCSAPRQNILVMYEISITSGQRRLLMAQGLLRYLTLISPIPRFFGRGSSPRVAQTPEDQSPGAERTCIPSVEFRQTSAIEIIPPLSRHGARPLKASVSCNLSSCLLRSLSKCRISNRTPRRHVQSVALAGYQIGNFCTRTREDSFSSCSVSLFLSSSATLNAEQIVKW